MKSQISKPLEIISLNQDDLNVEELEHRLELSMIIVGNPDPNRPIEVPTCGVDCNINCGAYSG